MKHKNRFDIKMIAMIILVVSISSLMLASCSSSSYVDTEINKNIDVIGVKLNMGEDEVNKLVGTSGESAPCIYGYEIAYESKAINIGFKSDTKKCRRVTTENPSTSIYGIKPGTTVEYAYKLLGKTPFVKDSDSKYKFRYKDMLLSLISTDGKVLKGLSIEITDSK